MSRKIMETLSAKKSSFIKKMNTSRNQFKWDEKEFK